MIETIHLIGSGPSAAGTRLRYPICSVNASWLLGPRWLPTIHVLGEIEGALAHPGAVVKHCANGVDVWMRPTALDALRGVLDDPALAYVKLADFMFGPPELRDLHNDVELTTCERNAWIGSGVLALWIILEHYRPRRVVVSGLDGYPVDAAAVPAPDARQGYKTIPGEYAEGLTGLPSRPARTATWCAAMNDRAAEGIERLTDWYRGTKVHFPVKPGHWRRTWRATRGRAKA